MWEINGPSLAAWPDRVITPRPLPKLPERNHQTFQAILRSCSKTKPTKAQV
jgi:hypothetical protein